MSVINKAAEYLKAYLTIKAMESIKDEVGDELKNYFNESDAKELVLKDENEQGYKINYVSTSRVTYDGDKLFNKIGTKEIRNKVVHNEATIKDWEKFASIMTKYNVPVDEVREYLDINKVVDKKEFQQQVEIGNIDLRDVADCYDIKTSDYLKVTIMK